MGVEDQIKALQEDVRSLEQDYKEFKDKTQDKLQSLETGQAETKIYVKMIFDNLAELKGQIAGLGKEIRTGRNREKTNDAIIKQNNKSWDFMVKSFDKVLDAIIKIALLVAAAKMVQTFL